MGGQLGQMSSMPAQTSQMGSASQFGQMGGPMGQLNGTSPMAQMGQMGSFGGPQSMGQAPLKTPGAPTSNDPFAVVMNGSGMSPSMSFDAGKFVESSPSAAGKNGKKDTSALDNIKW